MGQHSSDPTGSSSRRRRPSSSPSVPAKSSAGSTPTPTPVPQSPRGERATPVPATAAPEPDLALVLELSEYLGTPVILVDPTSGRLLHENRAARDLLWTDLSQTVRRARTKPQRSAGPPVASLFAAEDAGLGMRLFARAAKGEFIVSTPVTLATRGGESLAARAVMRPLASATRRLVALELEATHPLPHTPAISRGIEEFVRALFETTRVATIQYDPAGQPLWCNREAETIFRFSLMELESGSGGTIAPFFLSDEGQREAIERIRAASIESVGARRRDEVIITRRRRKDGHDIAVASLFSSLRTGSGGSAGVTEFICFVLDRGDFEHDARFSGGLSRAILENIRVGLVVFDLDGVVRYINPTMLALAGRTESEVIHRRVEAGSPENLAAMAALMMIDQVKETGHATAHQEFQGMLGGKIRTLRYQGMPLPDMAGRLRYVLAIVDDVTEARALELQLIQSEKLASMGHLAAGMAHEIRSPLNTIYNALYDLRELVDLANREVAEDIDTAVEEVQRVQGILNSLLDFAHTGGDGSAQRIDLHVVMQKTIRLITKECANLGIRVETDLDHADAWIHFSENSLKQVLLNLIVNAMQSMPGGGTLSMRTHVNDLAKRVTLEVEDTGTGMSPEVQRHIFDPFFTTKEPGRGTGLGLSVVHAAVKQHGGAIDVRSAPGEGATFTLTFPVRVSESSGQSR